MSNFSTSADFSEVFSLMDRLSDNCEQKLAQIISADIDRYVPKRTGFLRSTKRIEPSANGIDIVYDADYARPVYYMPTTRNFTTPGTTSYWFEFAKSDNLVSWVTQVGDFIANES